MGQLFEEIQTLKTVKRNKWNSVKSKLSDEELDDLKAVIADESITANTIVTVLRSRGIDIDRYVIYKWRRGEQYGD